MIFKGSLIVLFLLAARSTAIGPALHDTNAAIEARNPELREISERASEPVDDLAGMRSSIQKRQRRCINPAFVPICPVSVSATDAVEASALFQVLSATVAFPTPTQASLPLSGPAPSATPPPSVATATSTNAATASTSTPAPFTGAATSLRPGIVTSWIDWKLRSWGLGALVIIPLIAWL
ncbi:MAG: hypothetical protein M1813_007938 [Trichoglossum hirsutum]|nr:MAG: hypothetical protein M1813_007938 [Trichoglossum hirsutum]